MEFIVAETIHYLIEAEDGISAIDARKRCGGVVDQSRTSYRASEIPKLIQPIPSKDWPLWAKALAMMSKPEDKGIGDVVARMIGEENSSAFKAWHLATFGKPCGCNGRQNLWNIKYPLNSKAT